MPPAQSVAPLAMAPIHCASVFFLLLLFTSGCAKGVRVTYFDTDTTERAPSDGVGVSALHVLSSYHQSWLLVFDRATIQWPVLRRDLLRDFVNTTCHYSGLIEAPERLTVEMTCDPKSAISQLDMAQTEAIFARWLHRYGEGLLSIERNRAYSHPVRPHGGSGSGAASVPAAAAQTGVIWNLDRIDQRGISSSGYDNRYTYASTGAGIDVYVVDTGIYEQHVEFGGRAQNIFNAVNDGIDNTDCHGHGTHVGGTIGAATYGVAKGVTLLGVKVLDCTGNGSSFTVAAGLEAVEARVRTSSRKAVVNQSVGGSASNLIDAVTTGLVRDEGVALAVAAGNSAADACHYSPGRNPLVIATGASNFLLCVEMWLIAVAHNSSFSL